MWPTTSWTRAHDLDLDQITGPALNQGRRFHLQQRIGAGAYGEVFLAEQDSGAGFRKRVAIKLLHARLEGMADAGKRFRDEARILGRLSHRHIVTVLDLVQLEERWALIMDYVPGADLEGVLDALTADEGAFPAPAALEAAAAICTALDAAFRADDGAGGALGVIHRDIKPSNVRLTLDGEVKVLDFGVASVNLETREAETGMLRMGTERYMAPERILGEDSGQKGDVYAVGATLAELLLGEPIGRTPVLSDRHATFLEDVRGRLESRLEGEHAEAIISDLMRSLAEDPDDRPAPAEWAPRLTEQARHHPGESLSVFAGRFVGTVDAVLGHEVQVVSGVLSEGTLPVMPSTLVPAAGDGATWVGDEPSVETAIPRRAGAIALAGGLTAGLLAVIGVALFALAIVQSQRGEPESPPPAADVVERPAEAPEPVVEPTPVVVEPDLVVEPESEPEPVEAVPVAPRKPRPKPKSRGATVDRAMFVVADASSVTVSCGDISGSGSQAVRLRKFSGGDCSITATYLGRSLTGTASVTSVREVRCAPTDEALTCD